MRLYRVVVEDLGTFSVMMHKPSTKCAERLIRRDCYFEDNDQLSIVKIEPIGDSEARKMRVHVECQGVRLLSTLAEKTDKPSVLSVPSWLL